MTQSEAEVREHVESSVRRATGARAMREIRTLVDASDREVAMGRRIRIAGAFAVCAVAVALVAVVLWPGGARWLSGLLG